MLVVRRHVLCSVELLLPICIVALACGGILQCVVAELPARYRWLRPYIVLRDMFATRWVPALFAVCYGLGLVTRAQPSGLGEMVRDVLALVRPGWNSRFVRVASALHWE